MTHLDQLGKYRLIERIAVGGMAEIYKATTAGLGGFEKILAIKRLHTRYNQDNALINMLIDEAKIAVQLSHSNIGQIFDLDQLDGTFFICMEYIDGRDLHRVLRRTTDVGKSLPIDIACFIAKQVCSGLDYAHRKVATDGTPLRIIHRDVSPQNILISWEGEVKVVDFGIAKAARRACETESGIIKGKFYYMSPEQARGEQIDHRSDIFSLGVVLYEALTGKLLFGGDGSDDKIILSRVRRAQVTRPSKVRRGIPARLDQVLLRALARDRRQRYQSAAAFGDALSRFLHQHNPEMGEYTLAAFMQQTFGDLKGSSPQANEVPANFLSKVEYQADETSLIYNIDEGATVKPTVSPSPTPNSSDGPQMNAPDPFENDPFFDEGPEPGVAGGEGSEVFELNPDEIELIDEREIEIVDEGGPSAAAAEDIDALEEEVTRIWRADPKGDDVEPGEPVPEDEEEPTRVYRPQAILAASPDADRGPLYGEAAVEEEDLDVDPSEEATVITNLADIAPPSGDYHPAHTPQKPLPMVPSQRAVSGAHVGWTSERSSPVVIGGMFVIVLALGAVIAFGIQLLFTSETPSTSIAAPTEIEIQSPTITAPEVASYSVTSVPTEAQVTLDGVVLGPTPMTLSDLYIDRNYNLRLEADGFRDFDQTITPSASGTHSVAYTMEALDGIAHVTTEPEGAAIFVDGEFLGNSPTMVDGLDTERLYRLSASIPGHIPAQEVIEWPEGSNLALRFHLYLPPTAMVSAVEGQQGLPTNTTTDALALNNGTQTPTTDGLPNTNPPSPDGVDSGQNTTPPVEHVAATTETSDDEEEPTRSTDDDDDRRRDDDDDDDDDRRRDDDDDDDRRRDDDDDDDDDDRRRDDDDDDDRYASRDDDDDDDDRRRDDDDDEEEEEDDSDDVELGRISVLAEPDAQVFIDGDVISTSTPLVDHELPPGTYEVKVYFISLRRFSEERQVRVSAGRTRSVVFRTRE